MHILRSDADRGMDAGGRGVVGIMGLGAGIPLNGGISASGDGDPRASGTNKYPFKSRCAGSGFSPGNAFRCIAGVFICTLSPLTYNCARDCGVK